jgi:hypothetical protein
MKNVRPTDGTVPHRRHARYHIDALASGGAPIHAQLAAEMSALYVDLKARSRATEDAEDDWLGASARTDAAELSVKNAIRRLDTEARRADQEDASLNAQHTVFPEGFGAIVEPDGEALLKMLTGVYVRASGFLGDADIAAAIGALKSAQATLEARLADEAASRTACDTRFAEEQEARRRIREQLDAAYGLLRGFYKGRAAMAEAFFYYVRLSTSYQPRFADDAQRRAA